MDCSILKILLFLKGSLSKCPRPAVVFQRGTRFKSRLRLQQIIVNILTCLVYFRHSTIVHRILWSVVETASAVPLRNTYNVRVVDFTTEVFAVLYITISLTYEAVFIYFMKKRCMMYFTHILDMSVLNFSLTNHDALSNFFLAAK